MSFQFHKRMFLVTGRPGHWSEPSEYNILFLGSFVVIFSSQDSSALGYREFKQEGPVTISPFAARKGTSAPQWPNVKKMLSSPRSVQWLIRPVIFGAECSIWWSTRWGSQLSSSSSSRLGRSLDWSVVEGVWVFRVLVLVHWGACSLLGVVRGGCPRSR